MNLNLNCKFFYYIIWLTFSNEIAQRFAKAVCMEHFVFYQGN